MRLIDADELPKVKFHALPYTHIVPSDLKGLQTEAYERGWNDAIDAIVENAETADVVEVKHGKWTDKQVIHAEEAKEVIEEWQSCRCSICDHYNTQPYMYYFSEPNYCSFCGADMRERGEDETD